MTKIKICGMRDAANIKEIAGLSPDYMGFIFYKKSPRYVGDDWDPAVIAQVPPEVRRIGVFVNEPEANMEAAADKYRLFGVQLHGNESPEKCRSMKMNGLIVIKAFGVNGALDLDFMEMYDRHCDYFLFDTASKNHGGAGEKFDWERLKTYKGDTPFFLSGGIGPDDVEAIRSLNMPNFHAVDVNSRFETEPGIKNVEACRRFIGELRKRI
ncbi:MAG: phosphoribosylanthranilate isomerase [Flavobacteriales bacterium]|nr:phosphoribosylanthranilate isomerase [Flavobacteriales bacterium]